MQMIFSILAFFCLCLNAVYDFLFPSPAILVIRQNLGFDVKPISIELHSDTHGGFHGDGEELIVFYPTAEQIEEIEAEWKKTPVENGIAYLIFPDSEYNGTELREYIPESEGFWFYENRNQFRDGYSYNFTFALFDGEKVYYYEYDS